MFTIFNKYKKLGLLLAIILPGVFLRTYHFSDWLHFELDQSRDAKVISTAIQEGPENLPLLGPRAGGTFLRLGPAFYYFQYLSGLFFGDTPDGIAVANLIFSIASILIFYFFIREYFSKKLSILLLSLYSISLFLVMYSRFAWNPNSLPFFEILTFYSLLRAVKYEEKKKGFWLLIFAFSLAVSTQLHFLALIALPVACAIFLLIKRPKISWRYWIGALAIIIAIYAPVGLNELKTKGANAKEFVAAISGKSEEENHSLWHSFLRDIQENGIAEWLIISGNEKGEALRTEGIGNPINVCDRGCRKNLPYTLAGVAIFLCGLILALKNLILPGDKSRKNFVFIVSIFFSSVFAVFLPLSFDLSPRFFLLTAPIYIIFLGFALDFISKISKNWLIIIIAAFFVVSNLYFDYKRFNEIKDSRTVNVEIETDKVLKERARVTLAQQMDIVRYIESKQKVNVLPVYLKSDSQYDRSLNYLLSKKMIIGDFNLNHTYHPGRYFLVWRTSSDMEEKNSNYLEYFEIQEKMNFGTLTAFYLNPKSEFLVPQQDEKENKEDGSKSSSSKVPVRYTWKEFFSSFDSKINKIDDTPEQGEEL